MTKKFKVICIICVLIISPVLCGVMHSHTNELNKERSEDGSFITRDHKHFSDSGEHDTAFDHEAILGSHAEAEEFDHLPPEEAKKRLKILLQKMDRNNDKNIDRKELKAWILRSFSLLSEEEAKERMEDVDTNQDGFISWEEHKNDAFDTNEEMENSNIIEDDQTIWNTADINKDGLLDLKEYTVFTHPEEHPTMLPIFLEQTLRDKDKNKDGAIDFQEFAERGEEHDKKWLLEQKDSFDNDYDKDHDGKLTGNEILSWIVPSNDEIADDEVDHLFGETDDDHDELLSFEEILEHYETFVGSEATDYGDILNKMHHFDDEL